jgi:hypothetical protein
MDHYCCHGDGSVGGGGLEKPLKSIDFSPARRSAQFPQNLPQFWILNCL